MMTLRTLWPTLRVLAFLAVAGASGYAVHSVREAQQDNCENINALRTDLVSVLEGAGKNERAQQTVILRVATPGEAQAIQDAFEPGLAADLERVKKGIREC